MKSKMKLFWTILMVSGTLNIGFSQIFIDDGTNGTLTIRDASGGTLGTEDASDAIYVDGDVTIEGTYDNEAAQVRIRGNFTNNGTFITTGDEVFAGDANNVLDGALTGTNDFHNLLVHKSNTLLIDLNTDVDIDATGEVEFTASGGIIRTNSNHIYVKNPSGTSISSYSGTGEFKEYIEGTLRRAVNTGVLYKLPVGDDVHGHQLSSINFDDLGGGTWIEVSYDNTSFGVVTASQFCDVVDNPASDELQYTEQLGTWTITSNGTNGNYDYSVTLSSAGANVFTGAVTHDAMLKDGVYQHCSDGIGNYNKANLDAFSTFTMQGGTTIIPLPIELLGLYARPIDNKYIALNWDVASELNADRYEIERSTNGRDFMRIGEVTAIHSDAYSFDDYGVVGNVTYFYRLKMIDLDGTYEYSDIVSAKLDADGGVKIVFLPNPMNSNNAFLTIESDNREKAMIYVSNVLGQVLYQKSIELESDLNQIDLRTDNWSSGTYFITMESNYGIVSKKVIFQN